MVTVQLTTNPGFEDLVIDELRARIAADGLVLSRVELRPDGLAGHVSVDIDATWHDLRPALLSLRSAHRAVRSVAQFILDGPRPLDQIKRMVSEVVPKISELDDIERSFRVTSSRTGTHSFTSEDVQRVAGAGVRAVARHPVSLKAFDVEIRCDVRKRVCKIGVQLGPLFQRRRGPYTQRTSLRSNVAWALLQLARPDKPPERLLDPFCGAGTVLLEAGLRWPRVQLAGVDRLEAAAQGTRDNLLRADLIDRADVRWADARALLEQWPSETFDTVVCNPPFGKRLGRGLDLARFYGDVLHSLAAVCRPDARLVMVAQRRHAFNRALHASARWSSRHVRVFELGGLYVGAFVLEQTRA
ncbi:MAG: THUMP domain-containing protein [Myxococcota bacterium]